VITAGLLWIYDQWLMATAPAAAADLGAVGD
jgi:hypothetical protein